MAFVHDFGMDAAGNFINIDKLVEAFSSAQEAEGITKTFEENENVIKSVKTSNNITQTLQHTQKKGGWFCGVFMTEDDDFDDDGDGIYVCEYCDKLGYHQKYRPEICDSCRVCDSCNQYENGECSGCSYSIYRDGEYYRDKISESELMSDKDIELFQMLESDLPCERFKRKNGVVTKQR